MIFIVYVRFIIRINSKLWINIYFWLRFIFIYQKFLKTKASNRFLSTKPPYIWICVLAFLIHKGYFVVQKLVYKHVFVIEIAIALKVKIYILKESWIINLSIRLLYIDQPSDVSTICNICKCIAIDSTV